MSPNQWPISAEDLHWEERELRRIRGVVLVYKGKKTAVLSHWVPLVRSDVTKCFICKKKWSSCVIFLK